MPVSCLQCPSVVSAVSIYFGELKAAEVLYFRVRVHAACSEIFLNDRHENDPCCGIYRARKSQMIWSRKPKVFGQHYFSYGITM